MDITGLWSTMSDILIEADLSVLDAVEVSAGEPGQEGYKLVILKRVEGGWKAIVRGRDVGSNFEFSVAQPRHRDALDALRDELPAWVFGGKRPMLHA